MGLCVEQGVPNVLLVGSGHCHTKGAAQVQRFGGVEEGGRGGPPGDRRLLGRGLEGGTDTEKIVEGADVDVGAAVDRPWAEGDGEDLG